MKKYSLKFNKEDYNFYDNDWFHYHNPYEYFFDVVMNWCWCWYWDEKEELVKNILLYIYDYNNPDHNSKHQVVSKYDDLLIDVFLHWIDSLWWVTEHWSSVFWSRFTKEWKQLYEDCILKPLQEYKDSAGVDFKL